MPRQSVTGGSELGSLREKEDDRACLPFVGGWDVEVDKRGDGGGDVDIVAITQGYSRLVPIDFDYQMRELVRSRQIGMAAISRLALRC